MPLVTDNSKKIGIGFVMVIIAIGSFFLGKTLAVNNKQQIISETSHSPNDESKVTEVVAKKLKYSGESLDYYYFSSGDLAAPGSSEIVSIHKEHPKIEALISTFEEDYKKEYKNRKTWFIYFEIADRTDESGNIYINKNNSSLRIEN